VKVTLSPRVTEVLAEHDLPPHLRKFRDLLVARWMAKPRRPLSAGTAAARRRVAAADKAARRAQQEQWLDEVTHG
jgi:hypothetical protein